MKVFGVFDLCLEFLFEKNSQNFYYKALQSKSVSATVSIINRGFRKVYFDVGVIDQTT